MESRYEKFFENNSFAVVGESASRAFPKLTYNGLKASGKTVFPVDPTVGEVEGDKTYQDLQSLPQKPEAVVLEVPKEKTLEWVKKAADAGIMNLWMHMNTDTPEALALAEEKGMNTYHGTCAAMYAVPGFSFHSIHKWINKLVGKY